MAQDDVKQAIAPPLPGEEARLGSTEKVGFQRRFFRPVPFAVALAFSIGFLVLFAVAAVLVLQWSSNRKNTLELLNEKAEATVERLEAGLSDHLTPVIRQSDYLAARVAEGSIDITDKEKLAQVLLGALSGTPELEAMVIWDKDLQHIGVERTDGKNIHSFSGDDAHDHVVRDGALQMLEAEGAFWGDVVFGQDHSLLNLRRPLRADGEFVGFLVSVITVPALSELVALIGDRLDSTAFILFGRDKVLAHPILESSRDVFSSEKPLVDLHEVGDVVLDGLWDGEPLSGFERAADQDVHVVSVASGGQEYVAIYKWIDSFGDVPWLIGAWFPAEDVESELKRLWWSGLGGVLVLVLSVIGAVLLGRVIAAPIRRVAASTAEVGSLDLVKVGKLPPSKILELDEQANAFNRMLEALKSFETYVPQKLVQRLIQRDGSEPVTSRERELTIMFTDIVGFTTASEKLSAGKVAAFLNRHFAIVGSCVEAEGGTVDKFIGDGLMAFWGAPEAQEDTALRACRAALAISKAIGDDNQERFEQGKDPVRVRIGIHSGPVVVGDIGWPGRINYTIVGDAVNSCQRLEQAGKQEDRGDAVTILLSGQALAAAGKGFLVEKASTKTLRGRRESLEVYRLIGEASD